MQEELEQKIIAHDFEITHNDDEKTNIIRASFKNNIVEFSLAEDQLPKNHHDYHGSHCCEITYDKDNIITGVIVNGHELYKRTA